MAMSLEELIPSGQVKSRRMYSIFIRTALVVSSLIVGLLIPFFGKFSCFRYISCWKTHHSWMELIQPLSFHATDHSMFLLVNMIWWFFRIASLLRMLAVSSLITINSLIYRSCDVTYWIFSHHASRKSPNPMPFSSHFLSFPITISQQYIDSSFVSDTDTSLRVLS